jgi:hypothetical protein
MLIPLFITTTITFLVFPYQLYLPTLTIVVPNGYSGEINLVLSNVEDNILTIHSNGIGYLNESTFDKTYSRLIVKQTDGKHLDEYLIGFNSSTFFRKSIGDGNSIRSLSFKILTSNKKEEKHDAIDWIDKVGRKLVLLKNPDKAFSNKAIEVKIEK